MISFTQVVVIDHFSLFIESQETHVPAKKTINFILTLKSMLKEWMGAVCFKSRRKFVFENLNLMAWNQRFFGECEGFDC